MNETNIFVRLLLAIIFVAAVFIVLSVLFPLFSGVSQVWVNAIMVILQVATVLGAIYYVLTGRKVLA